MNQVSLYNKIFMGGLFLLASYALIQFHNYMDGYEVAILISSIFVFSWLGFSWTNFKNFFVTIFLLSFLSIFLYQGNLLIVEENSTDSPFGPVMQGAIALKEFSNQISASAQLLGITLG